MALNGRNETMIDVESLATFMKNRMRGNERSTSTGHCIFRTPNILARHNKEAYIPNSFSFGPFHHGLTKFEATEEIKLKYLQGLLIRRSSHNPDATLKECLESVKAIEGNVRCCYAGHLDPKLAVTKNFVEMLVLDGCFIIELFRKHSGVVPKGENDPIFSVSCMMQFLRHDLILLENQIPWFVLERLFDKTKGPSETKSLIELALDFFSNMFTSHAPTFDPKFFENEEVKHILHLLRLTLVLPSEEVKNYEFNRQFNKEKLGWQPIPSATRLEEAGVRFVKVNASSILDLKFGNGVLEIPSLLIQETSETIFRNLISYEQCLPNCKPIFTSYAKIMDNLIDFPNDMEILCKKKILDNWLSPDDATQFFNKLYNDGYVKEFYYGELCDKLYHHCNRWWPRWRAAYAHNYFTKPWAIAAQVYAIIMFGLALWQALAALEGGQSGKSP